MKKNPLRPWALGTLIALGLAPLHAQATEAAEPAASKASSAVTRTGQAIQSKGEAVVGAAERGVKRGASAVEHGFAVAGSAVERAAQKVGLPASSASSAR
ncbi:hypothetical protein [Azohydromonas australica]|uniref:hypothetical protein n=1 Tax=Azohydromonas australica TaxID=364039 RepID=UPI00040CD0B4|nr:hypothetical protein [Azohydromonas australica]